MIEHTPHHVPTLFYALAFIATGYFIYNLRRLFTVRIGKAVERPLNFFSQLFNSLSFGVGQRKVYSKQLLNDSTKFIGASHNHTQCSQSSKE